MRKEVLLETDRLYLRRLLPEDVQLLHELDSDPEVMRFISKGETTPLARMETDIMPRVLGYYRAWPPQGFWIAHLCDSNDWVGWFHLRPDKISPEEMEIGYRLKRSAWGRGLATEGSRALVQRAFGEWGYGKVCARTLTVNMASRRVMEKAGLQFKTEFLWPESVLPGWTEQERRGVKYGKAKDEAPANPQGSNPFGQHLAHIIF
jgi:RimJ/RimL family protein N-acetyltransferase